VTTTSFKVSLNGVNLGTFAPPSGTISFYSNGGTDSAAINGIASKDAFAVTPAGITMNAFTINLNQIATTTLNGLGGINTLTGPNQSNSWIIPGNNAGTLNSNLSFTLMTNLTGGGQDDAFHFVGAGKITGNVDGGAGSNALDFSSATSAVTVNLFNRKATGVGGNWANIQAATGTGTTDTLIGRNVANTWMITGLNVGSVNGDFTFTRFANLTGGSANDIFQFSDGAAVSGLVDGKASTNTLDYSAYTTSVYVNLLTGAATGTGGIANFRRVLGGQANDILVGDNLTNVLLGQGGRNLIIGEGGADTLTAGSGGDLLIAGRTSFATLTGSGHKSFSR
jgi:hypothetical protein